MKYELMVIDAEPLDLLSRTMEAKVWAIDNEVDDTVAQMEAEQHAIKVALNRHAFEFPELAHKLRSVHNTLAALMGEDELPDTLDPITQHNADGDPDAEVAEALKYEAEQEELEIERMKKSRDGEILKAECQKVFRQISRKCHPDRVSDRSLWPTFDTARKAFKDYNLTMLKAIWADVQHYLKVRTKNMDFQQYLARLIEYKQKRLSMVMVQKAEFHLTIEYEAMRARQVNNKAVRRRAYAKVIEKNVKRVETAIAKKQAELDRKAVAKVRSKGILSKFF